MKKTLAILLALLMVVTLFACAKEEAPVATPTPTVEEPTAPAEEPTVPEVPAEGGAFDLATTFPVGIWPLAAGTYDPALDGQGIPSGADLYGLFDAAYAVIPDPSEIDGLAKVDAIADLADGTWFLLVGSSGFNYIVVGTADLGEVPAAPEAPAAPEVPAAPAGDVPAELATAFPVGVWPLAAGTYDPALDGQGIPDGATIYGLFDAAYAVVPNPTAVTGYTEVTAIGDLAAGNWFLLVGSSGFNYVIVK
jgi:hypothetical protein